MVIIIIMKHKMVTVMNTMSFAIPQARIAKNKKQNKKQKTNKKQSQKTTKNKQTKNKTKQKTKQNKKTKNPKTEHGAEQNW